MNVVMIYGAAGMEHLLLTKRIHCSPSVWKFLRAKTEAFDMGPGWRESMSRK